MQDPTVDRLINLLRLKPHPEGGWYRRTYEHASQHGDRPLCTAIYYLMTKGSQNHWHKIDADELWHYYAGAPVQLRIGETKETAQTHELSSDIFDGGRPQRLVPANHWQRASTNGPWSLVGCSVAPGFLFQSLEIDLQRPE